MTLLDKCSADDLQRLAGRMRQKADASLAAAKAVASLAKYGAREDALGGAEDCIRDANDYAFTADLLTELSEKKKGPRP